MTWTNDFTIPKMAGPGTCTLIITVTDHLSGLKKTREVPIELPRE